jgi:hypothetical protein
MSGGNMSNYEKEQEVYNYVKENAAEFMSVIVRAMNDGIQEENLKLRLQKSQVETGLMLLADKVKLEKIDPRLKSVLLDALKSCTFFKVDSFIQELENKCLL